MSTPPSLLRSIMTTTKDPQKVVEGIFAVNKPGAITSAGVLRTLERRFNPSDLFAPWLKTTRRQLVASGAKKRTIDNLKVKLGHGGTLDPLATGVLVVGVGRGTKCLGRFLKCTKTYECVVLFGAATDTYDVEGKVVATAEYKHVTRERVEEALNGFRGKGMQTPNIFSALKVDGKAMYEYAREGGDIPEMKAREIDVVELEMVEWMEGGSHGFEWPKEEFELDGAGKLITKKLFRFRKTKDEVKDEDQKDDIGQEKELKREREDEGVDSCVSEAAPESKKLRMDPEPVLPGALPADGPTRTENPPAASEESISQTKAPDEPSARGDPASAPIKTEPSNPASSIPKPNPPAARLRMTVSSGFYVRSLCHDLGLAVDSLGIMSSLIRSRQGDYELGRNVIEYSDLEKGEEVWGPKVQATLEEFMKEEKWEAEEVVVDDFDRELQGGDMDADQRDDCRRDRSGNNRRRGGLWKGKGGRGSNQASERGQASMMPHD
ncbi:pseudouridine synthase [Lepidopterella palustris CBS 459.81]|uniref:tRNA pseudouridine(55) synthase n=1 Tax=Lepidopterella palustris CBS 459.81 TaxID=1314670 RepID=A0A8E2ED61_9PEZI|nr:pseudouridine synthase [Lepidopterella palustris CBS 459.81]